MGCDIHIGIQVQESNGTWTDVPYQEELWECEKRAVLAGKTDDYWYREYKEGLPIAPSRFANRNYDLFGILANVRNGRGFAGIVIGDGWPSIAADRGLPEGVALPSYNDDDGDDSYVRGIPSGLGDHSFTYVTLDELKAYDWDGVTSTLYGVISEAEYLRRKKAGTVEGPDSYSGDNWGNGVHVYTPAEYEEAKAACTLAPRPHVRVAWTETAREATDDWPGHVIPFLEGIGNGRPVRLLLGFDS